MLKECIEVFEHQMIENDGRLVLDSHIPADGTYLVVGEDGTVIKGDILKNKKTKELETTILPSTLNKIKAFDYYSLLVSMNKPVDSKKIVHSNNYLSFAVKKDSIKSGKLTNETIDNYFDTLADPLKTKYSKSKEASQIYQEFEDTEGNPDIEKIECNRKWIKDHIFSLEGVNLDQKDYLKIYFEADIKEYERESERYLLPNIYNSNDYNVKIQEKIYGIPDNNLGMNAKKPFLSIKTRKNPASYLLDREEVILQKQFFDYLMNLVSGGNYHVYFDTINNEIEADGDENENSLIETGYYLRLAKGKNEAEILEQDNISDYSQKLKKPFIFENILQIDSEISKEKYFKYGSYYNRLKIWELIDDVLFSKCLGTAGMYDKSSIKAKDEKLRQNILMSKRNLENWIFKGIDSGINNTIQKAAFNAIKISVLNEYIERALYQFNLMWSFREYFSDEGESDMGEIISELKTKVEDKVNADHVIPIESDDEYYFCVGQLARYLISLSRAKDKAHSLLNPILNAKKDEVLKEKLLRIYKKYSYAISNKYKCSEKLLAMILGYKTDKKVDQEKLILGYVCDNIVYAKKNKDI